MNSLENEVGYIRCKACGLLHIHADRVEDGYDDTYCPECDTVENYDRTNQTKQFKYWSVALYETGQQYGGPEEGGWWYSTGNLVEERKIRVFEDIKEADEYRAKIQTEFDDLTALGFSGKLPVQGWPNVKPRYC